MFPTTDSGPLVSTISGLNRSISFVQCGLMFFIFFFANYLRLTWRHYVFGIALGFGLIASIELSALALRSQFGMTVHTIFDFLRRGSYDAAVLIWIRYLLSPEPARLSVRKLPDNELERWSRALLQLIEHHR